MIKHKYSANLMKNTFWSTAKPVNEVMSLFYKTRTWAVYTLHTIYINFVLSPNVTFLIICRLLAASWCPAADPAPPDGRIEGHVKNKRNTKINENNLIVCHWISVSALKSNSTDYLLNPVKE